MAGTAMLRLLHRLFFDVAMQPIASGRALEAVEPVVSV